MCLYDKTPFRLVSKNRINRGDNTIIQILVNEPHNHWSGREKRKRRKGKKRKKRIKINI
jgi:hypothetical protein